MKKYDFICSQCMKECKWAQLGYSGPVFPNSDCDLIMQLHVKLCEECVKNTTYEKEGKK